MKNGGPAAISLNVNKDTSYAELMKTARGISLLGSAASVLGWDERTKLPPKGVPHRAEQMAALAGLCHERFTSPRVGELLLQLEQSDLDPLTDAAVNVRQLRRSYDRATKLDGALVEALSRTASLAEAAWVEAKTKSDYATFQPWLDKTLELKRQQAMCLANGGDLYDALLDEFEPAAKSADIARLFDAMRPRLVSLIDRIAASGRVAPLEKLAGRYPVEQQESFSRFAASAVGFDFDAGRLDTSAHPFCTELGPGDVRITTRYDEADFTGSLFGVLHETGHGLYSQGLPPEHYGTPRGEYISLGIHESQSRTWENLVGRSRAFWTFLLPHAREMFAQQLALVNDEEFAFAINDVRPSLIRTESDETTYNLHVMLRFDLERDLLNGSLSTSDLPAAWNERMKSDFGLTVPDDARGCLQDIHWAGGAIGYFPTYALGNCYASQFFEAAERELGDLNGMFAAGTFSPLLGWLKRNIHARGQQLSATQLVQEVTGRRLDADALMRHLEAKAARYLFVARASCLLFEKKQARCLCYINDMNYRPLGRTGFNVSEISFGAWAIGGSWGKVDDADSLAALNKAIDLGINLIDTADVYGDGRSERLVARLKRDRRETIYVATKAGRRLSPHTADGYSRDNLTKFIERSLQNLQTEAIDLLQLHCPPVDAYYRPEVFGVLDDLVAAGKLRFYGVSVEKVEEGLKAIDYPNVQSVQIIFNLFRQRPTELFFPECIKRKVGILARVPLASGLLTGKLKRDQQFAADDHRGFNRLGAAFDMGETFSGLGGNMDAAFAAVDEMKAFVPPGATRWRSWPSSGS